MIWSAETKILFKMANKSLIWASLQCDSLWPALHAYVPWITLTKEVILFSTINYSNHPARIGRSNGSPYTSKYEQWDRSGSLAPENTCPPFSMIMMVMLSGMIAPARMEGGKFNCYTYTTSNSVVRHRRRFGIRHWRHCFVRKWNSWLKSATIWFFIHGDDICAPPV